GLPDADLVVADPPRTGLPECLAAAIASSGAGTVLLLSCDAATFVRDLERLRRAGRFAPRSLTVVDQFPATRHLEVAALLKRET
ncbi:MAG TPA: 23S rRNA (uracil(1939)-C(5))-methyltransferase RlmD, partial [bacterium]|nr:23S rRNA (uracil(1939)-C(5))-methyltransferase RlmD [bacterium]